MPVLVELEDVVDLVILWLNDWGILYVNGEEYYQHHVSDVYEHIVDAVKGKYVRSLKEGYVYGEKFNQLNKFPQHFADVNDEEYEIVWS